MSALLKNKTMVGILSMLVATFIFMSINLIVKDSTTRYPVIEVVFMRNLFGLMVFIGIAAFQGLLKASLKSTQIKDHGVRALVGVMSLSALFYGYKTLPLADATALTFSTTLFMALFSGPLLGEAVGLNRWVAILVGFVGVVIMAKPGGDFFHWGAMACLLYALLDAFLCLRGRFLSRKDSALTLTLYFAFFSTILSAFALPFVWVTPTLKDLLFFGVLGFGGGIAQYLVTRAFHLAPVSVVGPMVYFDMVWGASLGYLVYGEVPGVHIWIGCVVVVGAGLYIVYQEAKTQPVSAQEAEPHPIKKAA